MTQVNFPTLPVLLVDDERQSLQSFEIALRSGGINNIISCEDSRGVLPLLAKQEIDVLLLDLWMPHISGEEILSAVVQDFPEIPVVIVTGVTEVETAVKCMKTGAFDYLVKPIEKDRLVTTVVRAVELRELRRENRMLKKQILSADLSNPEAFRAIITNSAAMKSVFQYVEAIAETSQPVLITGETGVGKELIARAVHRLSGRQGKFVPVNVAGLDDSVFADTLFGHKKGAFTDAFESRSGMIEQAANGTLFLDEIGDLSPASQTKLLRLLQEREYLQLGSDLPKRADARIIVATNQDIESLRNSGRFRKDLYYRLRTHHVHVPPLRLRKDDLPLLLDSFLEEAAQTLKKKKPTPPKELLALLNSYHFPGNIRELKSMVFDAVSNHRTGMLSMEKFKSVVGQGSTSSEQGAALPKHESPAGLAFPDRLPTLREISQQLVAEAMKRANGNQAIAAQLLGISRQALNRRLRVSSEPE